MRRRVVEQFLRPHRMPQEAYRGVGSVFYTICLETDAKGLTGPAVAAFCIDVLQRRMAAAQTRIDAFCFMPDHLHVLATGMIESADSWLGIVQFKQVTGKWFWSEGIGIAWQRRFDGRILNGWEAAEPVAEYIMNNPVRAGLVEAWQYYPHSGRTEWKPWGYTV